MYYKMELWIIIGMLIFMTISNIYTLIAGNRYYKGHNYPLFDLLHENLPNLDKYHSIVDIFAFCSLASLFFVSSKEITVEFITKLIVIMFIRSITIATTILPKNYNCDDTLNFRSFFLGGCYDKIFSGHTATTLLLTLIYYREHIINLETLVGINLVNMFFIIATRAHYTVDVLLSIFVTTTIYKLDI